MRKALTIAGIVWLELFRRKDLYVLLILLVALLFVLMSLNVFGLGNVVRYVMDVGLLFAWLFSIVLGVTMAARQLPQEESRRTIYPLLAKPLTRLDLVVGKWLGAWSSVSIGTIIFYAVVTGVFVLRGGRPNTECFVQALFLHIIGLGIITAIALLLSTRASYGAAATMAYVAVAASMTIAVRVPELLMYESGPAANGLLVLYFALPHLELFDLRQRLVHEWGPASWGTITGVLVYGVLWAAILLLLSWLSYRHKRFKRGALG